jgi:Trk K+ transport system NAD-binding subunit
MGETPLVLILGDDALVEQVCSELTSSLGYRVCVLLLSGSVGVAPPGLRNVTLSPGYDESLVAAGVREATAILALADDDELNLAVALRARMLNSRVQIVLRQSNTTLGRKIEQNLADCTVLSLAAHSAATYAAAALNQSCFFALRFPSSGGSLVGFELNAAEMLGVGGLTVFEAEQRLGVRVLAVNNRHEPPGGAIVAGSDMLTTFGAVISRRTRQSAEGPPSGIASARPRDFSPRAVAAAFERLNPILRTVGIAALIFFSLSYCYFHFALRKSLLASAFYVVATMTNVGFGEVGVTSRGAAITFGAIFAMIGGIVFTSILIGYVSSAITRAQWTAEQGLRRVRARGHVVVCGGGKIGRAVVDLTTAAGLRTVVIDTNPDATLVRRGRERDVDLLTGDATRDEALDLCDIPNAWAVLALTNSDAANLEIALGARARAPEIPLVVRMESEAFAQATAELFGIATFSPATLSAPAFAGLSRFPGTRGRVHFGGRDWTVAQYDAGAAAGTQRLEETATPVCVWRDDRVHFICDLAGARPGETMLYLSPFAGLRPPPPTPTEEPASTASAEILRELNVRKGEAHPGPMSSRSADSAAGRRTD